MDENEFLGLHSEDVVLNKNSSKSNLTIFF